MNNTSRRTRPNMIMTMTQPCTGTPVQGQTVVTAGPYCSGTPFTLSIANGPTESGLYYQWQSSPNANGPWFDIPGANNAAYTTTQAIATFYRRQTICIESEQSIDALGVLVDGAGCYCTAQVDNANAVGITNVTFNTINNTTASTIAYNNYTTIQSDAQRGQSYNLSARVNTNGGTNYTRAWIDWNNDGAYQPAEGYNLGNVTGGTDVNSGAIASVLVPMDAVLGATNMRVRTRQSPANIDPAACGSIENGEGEDYTLNVTTEMGLINVAGPAADVLVYGDHDGVQVKTKEASIASIKVYDMSGRLLAEKNGLNANHVTLIDFHSTGQVLIFKIFTNEGIIINKKVIL
jgi:hypothetical protein